MQDTSGDEGINRVYGGYGTDSGEGFYLVGTTASVGFHSYEEYADNTVRENAYNRIKDSDLNGGSYLSDHDFIYVPEEYKDHPEKITDIYISPRFCKVSFGDVFIQHFYIDDGRSTNNENKFCCSLRYKGNDRRS